MSLGDGDPGSNDDDEEEEEEMASIFFLTASHELAALRGFLICRRSASLGQSNCRLVGSLVQRRMSGRIVSSRSLSAADGGGGRGLGRDLFGGSE